VDEILQRKTKLMKTTQRIFSSKGKEIILETIYNLKAFFLVPIKLEGNVDSGERQEQLKRKKCLTPFL